MKKFYFCKLCLIVFGVWTAPKLAVASANEAFFDCVLKTMKGQVQSMEAFAIASCKAKHQIATYQTILQPGVTSHGGHDYIIERIKFRSTPIEFEDETYEYAGLVYDSLPSAPNLGAVKFKYSFNDCRSPNMTWDGEAALSFKPSDVERLESEKLFNLLKAENEGRTYIPHIEIFAENWIGVKLPLGQSAKCLAVTYVEANIVE